MAGPIGKTFVEISLDDKKYKKGIVDVKTTTKKKLSEIEKAWKGLGKKSEATYDQMRAKVNANYDKIKKHASSTADDIVRAEKAKNDKIARINKQQFGEQKSLLDKAKTHWLAFAAVAVAAFLAIRKGVTAVISTMKEWVNAAKVQELAEINLAAALKAAGVYTDALNTKYQEFASSIQKVTKYGDEQTLTLMALMKNLGVTTDRLEEATKMAIGLATATGRDVQSMAMYIALAEQGEFTMLRRYIPALRSTTDATEQMRIITEFAARGFKVAQDQTASFAIGLTQLGNLWGDLKEKLGDFIIKNEFVLDLLQKTKEWITKVSGEIEAWRKANQELIDQKMHEAIVFISDAINDLVTAFKNLAKIYDKIPDSLKAVSVELIKNLTQWKAISLGIDILTNDYGELGDAAGRNIIKMKIPDDTTKSIHKLDDIIVTARKDTSRWDDETLLLGGALQNVAAVLLKMPDLPKWEFKIDPSFDRLIRDRGEAARELYKDLQQFEVEYYQFSGQLIAQQAQRYRELGIDQRAINAWVTEQEIQAWRTRTLAGNSFVEGMKVGFSDISRAQQTWADHGMAVINDWRDVSHDVIQQVVDDFISGEETKIDIARITGDVLTGMAGRLSNRMFDAALDKAIDMIAISLGVGASGAGGWGATKGGVWGALKEIGLYLTVGVGAMLAGRTIANQFRAEGGWIGAHPGGGMIQQGSGVKDDVLLGYTPGMRHWGMGGEFVVNKQSTSRHKELLALINADRGMATGGYINRGYQEGAMLMPWKPVADMLAMGGAGSAIHGFYKGGPWGALAELVLFFVQAVPMMFGGKLLASAFKAQGGMIDAGHGFGDFITKPFDIIRDLPIIGDALDVLKDVPIVGPLITAASSPEDLWDYIKTLIRLPLEQIAKDMVTPGIYYPSGIDAVKTILGGVKEDILGFEGGGVLPHTGLFYGHEGERVQTKEEAANQGVTINSPLIHIGGNLVADRQTFEDFAEQIDYVITKRNKRTY